MTLIEQTSQRNGVAHGQCWVATASEMWSEAAPGRLRKLYPQRGLLSGWEIWQHWLATRSTRALPATRAAKRATAPLLWAIPSEAPDASTGTLVDAEARRLIERLWPLEPGAAASRRKNVGRAPAKLSGETAAPWTDLLRPWLASERFPIDLSFALESLAWARALPSLAATLDEDAWWSVWDKLVELSHPSESFFPGASPPEALAEQLLTAELPLTLAWLFPELAPAARLGFEGWRAAQGGLEQYVLGDGFLPARMWDFYRPFLACWTRAWSIAEALRHDPSRRAIAKFAERDQPPDQADADNLDQAPAVASDAERDAPVSDSEAQAKKSKSARPLKPLERPPQYERFLATTLRLCRADGGQLLVDGAVVRWDRDLFAAARRLAKGAPAAVAVRASKPSKHGSNKHHKLLRTANQRRKKQRLSAASRGIKAEAAILRPTWRRDSPRLAVMFDGGVTRLELNLGEHALLCGEWSLDVTQAGEPAPMTVPWEELCWVSDADVDYLELEAKLAGGMRVQRQMLLARRDRFLLLADCLLASTPAPLAYAAELPLAAGVSFVGASETVEGWLTAGEPAVDRKPAADRKAVKKRRDAGVRAPVLPLFLPEWRSVARSGALKATESALRLEQRAQGLGLFAPLLLDLDPRRSDEPFTWRQLTVGEGLRPLADDVAVGYRAQIAKRQWLVYRSLAPRASRTVLGQHLASEFMVGRFHTSGDVDRMLEVETE